MYNCCAAKVRVVVLSPLPPSPRASIPRTPKAAAEAASESSVPVPITPLRHSQHGEDLEGVNAEAMADEPNP